MFDFMKNMSNLSGLQSKMEAFKASLAVTEVEATSGAGAVRVVMFCNYKVKSVTIAPSFLTPDQHTIVEDLVKACMEEALKKVKQTMEDKLKEDLGLGFLSNSLPF